MEKEEWVIQLEQKYGMPVEQIPGKVYVLHYDPPQIVKSVSTDYSGPSGVFGPSGLESDGAITHYVGWTQQANPRKRIYRHGAGSSRAIVSITDGTMTDEQEMKASGKCPACGGSLKPAYMG